MMVENIPKDGVVVDAGFGPGHILPRPLLRTRRQPRKNPPFLFQKKLVARKSKKQGTFSFGVAERSEAVAGLSSFTNF